MWKVRDNKEMGRICKKSEGIGSEDLRVDTGK